MGRSPRCLREGAGGGGGAVGVSHKGPWTQTEDEILSAYIKAHSEGNWRLIPKLAGLSRCGKSCRLRWTNYLRPDLKLGNFSSDEDNLILTLHALLGNKWSLIARRIPGRTDNEVKNHWNAHLKRKLRSMGVNFLNYRVGLTLMPNHSSEQLQEDHTTRSEVSSLSSSDHHKTMSRGSSPQKMNANHSQLQAAPQRPISSPETSSSTSSYGSRSSASEFDSSAISEPEQPYGRPEATVLCSQQPSDVLGSSEGLPLHSPAENCDSWPGLACGWEYDHARMDSQMQHSDHAAAIVNLEHLDCFESGMLPLESQLQSDVQVSTLWTPLRMFDALV